jgi:uncharacterized protein YciI
MPLYAMMGFDAPDSIERREEFRAEHRAYVYDNLQALRLAGAFENADGKQIGSLLIFEAPDEAAVWKWIEAEPFYRAGIYATVEVRRWNAAIGAIAPGPVTMADPRAAQAAR